jgi:DNA-binding NarL/FixJ family response regulator
MLKRPAGLHERDGSATRPVASSSRAARSPIPVRVCIVYEHALFAHGIQELLQQEPTLSMVGLLERRLTAPRQLRRLRPDVVVVEGNGGLATLHSIESAMGVVISVSGDHAMILSGVPFQVSGPAKLADAIRRAARSGRRSRPRRGPP